ncbi:hypothetical protein SAMN05216167_107178 [Spirosoma endophyticum]|uniref:t-SNARE coiled-coil homology domain-containing protein n=2 Tax=Spirosoma endophyticum TaxID=662367 RepID=A0A1I1VGG6_9BACT|nr:hypothetical protein SAMN05216167_107178 [Spirosoma endophyticum]
MYLEERVGQLENLSVDHGRQIEIIAKGVADLTVTVNERFDQVINEMNQRFNQVDQRFSEVDRQFDKVDRRFDKINENIAELKTGQIRLETTVTDIQQTQQLILTLLQDRLK